MNDGTTLSTHTLTSKIHPPITTRQEALTPEGYFSGIFLREYFMPRSRTFLSPANTGSKGILRNKHMA